MRGWISGLLVTATLTLGSSVVSTAQADVAPPKGISTISYGFAVSNAEAFPDCVVLAYPYSMSNGAPTREVAVVGKNGVGLGRRGGHPRLWGVARTAYEKAKQSLEGMDVKEETVKALPGIREATLKLHPKHTMASTTGVTGITRGGLCGHPARLLGTQESEPLVPLPRRTQGLGKGRSIRGDGNRPQ